MARDESWILTKFEIFQKTNQVILLESVDQFLIKVCERSADFSADQYGVHLALPSQSNTVDNVNSLFSKKQLRIAFC